MNEDEKQEYITEEEIKEQMNSYKYIDNDGLLYSRKNKYYIED